jgi:hypothetical protein
MDISQAFMVIVNTARGYQASGKPSLEDAEAILNALRVLENALKATSQTAEAKPAESAPAVNAPAAEA